MKILLRNTIPTPAQAPDFTIVDGKVVQNGREYILKKEPGTYIVISFEATGTLPHINNSLTRTVDYRLIRHSKENSSCLAFSFFKKFIAVYTVEQNGEVILLVNTVVTPAPDILIKSEVLPETLGRLPNDDILKEFTTEYPDANAARRKNNVLYGTGLNDCLANQQLQIDLIMAVIKSNPPAEKPEWWEDFIDAMSGSVEAPNPIDRKGIPAAIQEVKKDRAALNALIADYKANT